jgi:DNA-binding NarL/FixJ family response regulator
MPKLNGVEVCSWLKENKPHIKPIILSIHDNQYIIENAIQQGAVAYVLKDANKEKIQKAIQDVHSSGFHFNEQFSHQMLIDLTQNKKINPNELTDREKEVAILICEGLSYKQIAAKLEISTRTVEDHKKNILRKIGATKVAGVVRYSINKGWVKLT